MLVAESAKHSRDQPIPSEEVLRVGLPESAKPLERVRRLDRDLGGSFTRASYRWVVQQDLFFEPT